VLEKVGKILHVGPQDGVSQDVIEPRVAMVEVEAVDYTAEVTTIWRSGPSSNRLDIVFLGDGYTQAELPTYHSHVERALNSFFEEEPFKSFKHLINVHRVDVISQESGIDNDPAQGVSKDTALGARLWCFGSQRSLCVNLETAKAFAENAEDADQIIVSANSRSYGGLAYSHSAISTFTGGNILSNELLLHEFGHSFGLLADEYDGTGNRFSGNESPLANLTTLSEGELLESGLKWADWIGYDAGDGNGSVGLFEGANLYSFGIFRPTFDSKMRTLGKPFNAPSVEALVGELFREVSPVEEAFPKAEQVESNQTLFLDVIEDLSGVTKVSWFVDGEKIVHSDIQLEPAEFLTSAGNYEITAVVEFQTPFVRSEAVADIMTASYSWNVNHQGTSLAFQTTTGVRCSFPNSFLGQVNIASLVNNGSRALTGNLAFYDSFGIARGETELTLQPSQKSDVSVFDLGLGSDEIGTICFSSDSDNWTGNLTLYAPGSDQSGEFDFAINYPFVAPESLSSTVPVNTFHLVSGEGVAFNWLRVIDGHPGDGEGLSGTVNYYDEVGALIAQEQVELVDGGRVDLAAHLVYGAERVGHAEFVASTRSPFYFEATRYYPKQVGGYYSAMPVQRRAPAVEPMNASFSQASGELNIVEIFNAAKNDTNALVVVRGPEGHIVSSETIVLKPKGSFHFIIEGFEASSGSVTVVGDLPIASRLLSYVFDSSSLVCGSSARAMVRDSARGLIGQFNSFLGQQNTLSLTNRSGELASISYKLVDFTGMTVLEGEVVLEAFGSTLVNLSLPSDSYGSIIIEADQLISAESIVDSLNSYQLVMPAG